MGASSDRDRAVSQALPGRADRVGVFENSHVRVSAHNSINQMHHLSFSARVAS